jgi:hypothetical protein
MKPKDLNRRDFLRLAGVGTAALFGSGFRRYMPFAQMDMEPFMPDAEVDHHRSGKVGADTARCADTGLEL